MVSLDAWKMGFKNECQLQAYRFKEADKTPPLLDRYEALILLLFGCILVNTLCTVSFYFNKALTQWAPPLLCLWSKNILINYEILYHFWIS
jgi:hypothetical protein